MLITNLVRHDIEISDLEDLNFHSLDQFISSVTKNPEKGREIQKISLGVPNQSPLTLEILTFIRIIVRRIVMKMYVKKLIKIAQYRNKIQSKLRTTPKKLYLFEMRS